MTTTPQSQTPSEREIDRRAVRRVRRDRALIAIAIPVVLSLLYYLLIAPSQYRAELEFTIQGTQRAAPDVLGNIGIPAASGSANDTRLVVDYLRSADMVELLRREYGFADAYARFTLDPTSRLSRNAPMERAEAFWDDHLKLEYDAGTNLVRAVVAAYRPDDAKRLAEGVVAGAERLVVALDKNAQNAALKFATVQLQEQKRDYEDVRRRVAAVRSTATATLDAQATQAIQAVTQMDGELARLRVESATAAATYQPDAPQARAIATQIGALERERAAAIARAQRGPGSGAANVDMQARTALLDYEFAQKSYYAALQAYQNAVHQSDGNHRYVVAFIPPRLPEQSNYWSRLLNVVAVAIGSAILIGTAMLTYSVVKDHMQ
jgi:capsular polysaccharide transport system permease protein